MLGLAPHTKVFVASNPVSMHKSFDGLAALVQAQFKLEPISEQIFIFFNRKRDKVKCLYWDRNGFCLWYKRLEKGRFPKLRINSNKPIKMTLIELSMLLEGIDLCHPKRLRVI